MQFQQFHPYKPYNLHIVFIIPCASLLFHNQTINMETKLSLTWFVISTGT